MLRSPEVHDPRRSKPVTYPVVAASARITTRPYDESRMNAPPAARPPGARPPQRRVSRERYLARRIGVVAVLALGLFGLVKAAGALMGGDDRAVAEGPEATASETAAVAAPAAGLDGLGRVVHGF